MQIFPSREIAVKMDQSDPLSAYRERFYIPEGVTYLVGHSLGPSSEQAIKNVRACLENEWRTGLVGSWNSAGWFDMARNLSTPLAELIGVGPREVMVTDTVSVNLFKLAVSASEICENPDQIYVDSSEFPTDQYMADSVAVLQGKTCTRIEIGEEQSALSSGAIYIKSAVNYRTAEVIDIEAYERSANSSNTLIIWDLSHATGVLNLELKRKGARLATGCTYKYLNAGPGAPAFLYVSEELIDELISPLPGWMGHARPFSFETTYEPTPDVSRFASGTPPILSLSALKGALEIYENASLADIEQKAQQLGTFAIELADILDLEIQSPREAQKRGGHISLLVENGYAISRALYDRGFHTDFRTPSTIRLGLSPLFIRYQDIWDVMSELGNIIGNRAWDKPEYQTVSKVT